MTSPRQNAGAGRKPETTAPESISFQRTEEDLAAHIRSRTPWHALGLAAGLLGALLLSLVEYLRLRMVPGSTLQGAHDSIRYLLSCWTVYGFITVVLGLGIGLSLTGWVRWLWLPGSWRRLKSDPKFRSRFERHWAAAAVLVPLFILVAAAVAFFVQRAFVRNMNNPTLAAAFLALAVIATLAILVWLFPLGMVLLGALLPRIGLARLVRKEPRLLRGTLAVVGLLLVAALAATFGRFYNPTVWSPAWVAFLFGTALLPLLLIFSGPLIRWARVMRHPAIFMMVLLAYLVLTGWTFKSLAAWEDAGQALLTESVFSPTVSGLIHKLTDRDGDGQSSLLAGGDCDDSNPAVYAGAPEIPGNGIDDNCLGGDAPLEQDGSGASPETVALGEPPDAGHPGPQDLATGSGSTGSSQPGTGTGTGESPQAAVLDTTIASPQAGRRNLIILLVDALRPDHLGFFGYERDISPNMDALASQSVVFERAYAQAPHTPRSIPSIFTSRLPSRIDFRNPGFNYPVVRDANLSLFEVLQEQGYHTLGLASHYYFEPRRGMDQGFDRFDNRGALSIAETNEVITAPDIFARLEEHIPELVESAQPFCLFIHYYEPHGAWLPHPEVVDFGRATGRQRHINNYDSEIAFVDIWVGRTLDLLRENGWYDDSIILLLSDHGEAFNEHGRFFHGQSLYEEEIRVVLFFKVPGYEPMRVATPVRLIDVAPTLLTLVDGQVPEEFMGRSLFPHPTELPQVDILSELLPYSNFQQHFVALIRDDLKLIYDVTRRRYEMYDLAADPAETENIYRTSDQAESLREALIRWME